MEQGPKNSTKFWRGRVGAEGVAKGHSCQVTKYLVKQKKNEMLLKRSKMNGGVVKQYCTFDFVQVGVH